MTGATGLASLPRMPSRVTASDDIALCLDIFYASFNALHAANGFEEEDPADAGWLSSALEHFLRTDPEGGRVALRDGGPVAFGSSVRRGNYWFMPFLFVLPDAQGAGIGKSLLADMLPPARDGFELATVVESFQPVSAGLYASLGMVPRSVRFNLSGVSRPSDLPALPPDLRRVPLEEVDHEAIGRLDRQVLGYERPLDHGWWAASGAVGSALLKGDEPIAYVYADGDYLSPALGADEEALCLVIADTILRSGDPSAVDVPAYGSAAALIQMLLNAGAKFDAAKYRYMYCSSVGPLPPSYVAFTGYLP